MKEPKQWLLTDLCASLHALSSDASLALAMQDPSIKRPDQLALKFGKAVLTALTEDPTSLTADQVQMLNALATLLREMSAQQSSLWTEEAVRNHPTWQEVRSLAAAALRQLDPTLISSRALH
jgi:hypothetical protein